jgi:hypothetical protein
MLSIRRLPRCAANPSGVIGSPVFNGRAGITPLYRSLAIIGLSVLLKIEWGGVKEVGGHEHA